MREIRNCRCAVVGGAGFLGSHLVDFLVEDRGCDVLVLDNLCAGRREFVNPKAELVHADITGSEHFLLDVFRKRQIRFVMNFAAFPYVPDSFARPLHVFDVNCFGAIKVINAAQEAGVEAILQVSSAEVYGGGSHGYKEKYGNEMSPKDTLDEMTPIVPHSSYGASKAAVDAYCQVAWRERKTPVIALRQFNTCGARETHPYIVPELVGQLSRPPNCCPLGLKRTANATVRLGNNTSRDLLHVKDAVETAVELLEGGTFGQVYNSGSESSIKMYDLATVVGRVMGFDSVTVERDEARVRPWDIFHLRSCNDKLNAVVQRRPIRSLQTALEDAVEWYRQAGNLWPWERN